MPNPSTLTADLEEQYAKHEALSRDLRLGKLSREQHLRAARRLAKELGIDGPPPINHRPPQAVDDKVTFTVHLSPAEKEGVEAALRLAQSCRSSFGHPNPLTDDQIDRLIDRVDGGE